MDDYENGDYGYTTRTEDLRKKERLTQEQLAEAIGVSTVLITGIEGKNKRLSLRNAIEIRKKFGYSLDWLYGLTEDTNDTASNIIDNMQNVFRIDWGNKTIRIDKDLENFINKLSGVYIAKDNQDMPEEAFRYWIEGLKRDYNNVIEEKKDIKKEYATYHLTTVADHEDDQNVLNDK